MTNSPRSSSEVRSRSFDRLDPRIQRWIWSAGWTALRDAQELAIPLILSGDTDVIIAASTAAGKTEAAFFPILTRLAQSKDERVLAMYISPLKALINDQWLRLERLAESMEIPVTPWHGDISSTRKLRFLREPYGCLLITPESIEAMLMRNGSGLPGFLGGLRYVVVDEMHSFMGTERGKQLQSQLHRIERTLQRRVSRIGLSATLGDMDGAKSYLRREDPASVELIVAGGSDQELKVLIKGYEVPIRPSEDTDLDPSNDDAFTEARRGIAAHMFQVLRGSNNLVFPNSRREVEFYADSLRRMCEEARVPNEFWPHHGSLSKEIREQTEEALKRSEVPATAICTNTLELGIDIGSVKSVAQVGSPPSVASLRQRLGRSGRRRGEPAILRGYALERQLSANSSLSDQLRAGLVQSAAMIRLLARGWYEPVPSDGLYGSTLVQQVLSTIAQHGGLRAQAIWDLLCENGPFSAVSRPSFISLLRELALREIVFQDSSGLILLAPKGERICEHYSFYATFSSEEEFRIVTAGRTLGSMPVTRPLVPGGLIIFAGRRWQVVSVSQEELLIEVRPGAAGEAPAFNGTAGASVHDVVRAEMKAILQGHDAVPFLDGTAQRFLQEARESFSRFGLRDTWIRQSGSQTHLLLWKGDRVNDTLLMMLQGGGFRGVNEGIYISLFNTSPDEVMAALSGMLDQPWSGAALAKGTANKIREKWDPLLPSDLLDEVFACDRFDLPAALETIGLMIAGKR